MSGSNKHFDIVLSKFSYLGNEKLIRLLIDYGSDINAVDVHNNTVLMLAILRGTIEL